MLAIISGCCGRPWVIVLVRNVYLSSTSMIYLATDIHYLIGAVLHCVFNAINAGVFIRISVLGTLSAVAATRQNHTVGTIGNCEFALQLPFLPLEADWHTTLI